MKVYRGLWLESLPSDAPDGSLWDVRHNDYEPDFEPSPEPVRCVVLGGSLLDREGRIARQSVTACRRVYPVGSVVPEPRPLTEELIRNCWKSHAPSLVVTTDTRTSDSWQFLPPWKALELCYECDVWGYQAESVEINGVLTVVAVPWFDQLGDSE